VETLKKVAVFDSAYSRNGVIEIHVDECDSCGEERRVLAIDSSELEYGFGKICKPCIDEAFNELEGESK
jgi:hypothetical protein